MIIAIGHRKGVGKDTYCNILIDLLARQGVKAERFAFADALKEMAAMLWGWDGLKPGSFYDTPEGREARNVKLPTIGKTPRELWIEFGNKMRDIYGPTWIQFVMSQCSTSRANIKIITDLRYPNELEALRAKNALCIKVQASRIPNTDDVADCALDSYTGWDHFINNNGTINELENIAVHFIRYITIGGPAGKRMWGMP